MIALAGLAITLLGAVAMGAAFSTLYPALVLIAVERVPETRRGSAVGTFTAFFDIGVGLGGPLTGAAVAPRRRLRGRVLGRGGLRQRRRGDDRDEDQNSFGCAARPARQRLGRGPAP